MKISDELSKANKLKEYISVLEYEITQCDNLKIKQELIDDLGEKINMFIDCLLKNNAIINIIPISLERVVLLERYFNGKTFKEIANRLGYKERRVFQLHKQGLETLQILNVAK